MEIGAQSLCTGGSVELWGPDQHKIQYQYTPIDKWERLQTPNPAQEDFCNFFAPLSL